MPRDINQDIAQHILAASSNLLGICFIILSFVKVNKLGGNTTLDEFLGLPIVLFFLASILSYMSLRAKKPRLEAFADRFFISGLLSLTIVALTFIFEVFA